MNHPHNWRPGNIVLIELGTKSFAYGRVIRFPLMAFYDLVSETPAIPGDIIKAPLAFRIWVMKDALSRSHWPVIGNLPLEHNFLEPIPFFKQDPISGRLSIYEDSVERNATYDECVLLERAAVWDPEHVESRLRDHFSGKPNRWVESLRPHATS